MTNHVHLIVIPKRENSLARGFGETHKRYTLRINSVSGAKGYLFQGRFFLLHLMINIFWRRRNMWNGIPYGQDW